MSPKALIKKGMRPFSDAVVEAVRNDHVVFLYDDGTVAEVELSTVEELLELEQSALKGHRN